MKIILSFILLFFTYVSVLGKNSAALAKSDSLFAKGVELYNLKKYKEAIPFFEESDRIDKAELEPMSNRRDYSVMWLASCYYKSGNEEQARKLNENYYKVHPIDRRLTVASDSVYAIGTEYYNNGNVSEALEKFKEAAEIEKSVLGENSFWYANSIAFITEVELALGNNEEAIRLGTEALDIRERLFGKEHPDYASLIGTLAYCYANLGDKEETIRHWTEALDIQEHVFGKESLSYATLLGSLASYYSTLGDYTESVKIGSEALSLLERINGKEHPIFLLMLKDLASHYDNLGNYTEVIRLGIEALDIYERLFGKDNQGYINSLSNLAFNYSKVGDYSEAIKLEMEELNITERILGKEHLSYANSLIKLAHLYLELGDYKESIRLGKESLNIKERIIGKENTDYATSLNILARYYSESGEFNEAVRLGTEALNIRERLLGKEHPDYATILHVLAHYYSELGEFNEAVRLGTEALNIRERLLSKEHPDYANTLNNLATYYSELWNYTEAIRVGTEALNIRERILGKDHPDYATSLNILASVYSDLGDYKEAIRLCTEALNIRERILGKENPFYATTLHNLAHYYLELGNYKEAIRLETEALDIKERLFGKEHPDYAISLNSLASYFSKLGNFAEAFRLGIEVLNIMERLSGKEHPDYVMALGNLAVYYSDCGNYTEAIKLCTEVLNIRERILGKEHPDYAIALNNLALYYSELGNYKEAIRLGTEVLDIKERILGKDHPDYAISLNNLAKYYLKLGNYAEAFRLGTEALDIQERILGKEHPDYAISLGNLSIYYSDCGNYTEAASLCIEALSIQEQTLGKEHPVYIFYLDNLSQYYYKLGERNDVINIANEVFPRLSNNIRKTFSGLTAQERNNFWNKYKSFFECDLNFYSYNIKSESIVSNAYNATLLSKGILLSTDMELSNILKESGDDKITELYNELRSTRIMLNKLYEKPVTERYLNTDSLERIASSLERNLVEKSKEYGDFTRNMTVSWQDVQSKLKQKDLAVEFVSFPIDNDSIIYAAFVINSQMNSPQMVSLFEAKELSDIQPDSYYNSSGLSRLVWNRLDSYLNDAENVYFAPAGELYNIAIEYLPHYNGEGLMSDFHNFFRLSSTRELAVTKAKNGYEKAALYGGMKFDTETSFLEKDMEKYPELRNRDFSLVNIADSLDLRYGAKELPGTEIEVDNIDKSLKNTAIIPLLYKGLDGTEASFKSLSGKRVDLMHVATHGFYWTETEAGSVKGNSFLMLGNENNARYVEDKALTRSGLLFSGANNVLRGIEMPDDVEDGILTAKEIAGLDLRGLDMVVLSACQTGLGEIKGDGVFGLQRGFKKAGANSLLMSLWKVDDKATQLLMTKFYEEFLGGKPKFEALKSAQKYIREYMAEETDSIHDRPYADPKYWAAFILLDALD